MLFHPYERLSANRYLSPGLPCPFFPAPTHGVELGLPAEVTVREAISGIDPNDPLHNPRELAEAYRLKPSKVLKPAEWDRPLGQLITTSGPLLLHPSGKRRFTTRECMRLNRFRDSHRLAACVKTKTDVHRLVGNAVPRDIVTLMSKSFIALLDEWMPMVEEYRSRNTIDFRYEDEDDDDAASVRAPKDNRRKASFKGRSNLGSLSRKMSKIDIEREEPEIVDRSSFVTSVPAEKRQRTLGDNFKVTKTAPPQSSVKREEARPGAFFDIVDLTKQ